MNLAGVKLLQSGRKNDGHAPDVNENPSTWPDNTRQDDSVYFFVTTDLRAPVPFTVPQKT